LSNKIFSFGKEEKLCSRKRIAEVFVRGKVVFSHPLKVSFIARNESEDPSLFLVSVPKRNLKKAVNRNRVKRLMRESIRLNKNILSDSRNKFDICIVYTGKKIPKPEVIDIKIKDVLEKIKEDN
jgi:ribonuclease P protein component